VLTTRRLPTVVRAQLFKQLDPDAGSPADSAPITLDLADRWAEAVNARDWAALGDMLTDDVRLEGGVDKRAVGRRTYVMTARLMARAYPDFRAVVENVVAQPAEPAIAWVQLTETGTPRRGPPLDVTWWERWTLDDSEQRIREIHLAGVVRLS
jgi:ketosteroid isomerase-like protein